MAERDKTVSTAPPRCEEKTRNHIRNTQLIVFNLMKRAQFVRVKMDTEFHTELNHGPARAFADRAAVGGWLDGRGRARSQAVRQSSSVNQMDEIIYVTHSECIFLFACLLVNTAGWLAGWLSDCRWPQSQAIRG